MNKPDYANMLNEINGKQTKPTQQEPTQNPRELIEKLVTDLTEKMTIEDTSYIYEKAIYKLVILLNSLDLTCFVIEDISNIKNIFSIKLRNAYNDSLALTLITNGMPITDIECFIINGNNPPKPLFNGINF